MSGLQPVYMTTEELIAVLDDIRARLTEHDSWEGSLEYALPWSEEMGDPETDPPDGFRVHGAYRIGNNMGQGGMRLIGTIPGRSE